MHEIKCGLNKIENVLRFSNITKIAKHFVRNNFNPIMLQKSRKKHLKKF